MAKMYNVNKYYTFRKQWKLKLAFKVEQKLSLAKSLVKPQYSSRSPHEDI